ncbi:hypothetical protein SPWS13_3625 [Shewanella putrefaciens]|nr:hypothetical protein SPWS13_3625 [Shewanella putrefaciens]
MITTDKRLLVKSAIYILEIKRFSINSITYTGFSCADLAG